MEIQHKQLAQGSWKKLSLVEQMANIGSEVERAIKWKNKNNVEYKQLAFDRALELLDLTLVDDKNKKRLKEITRLREALADYFVFKNEYHSTDKAWHNYFHAFNYAARI
ncbi:hypothetical protein CO115_01725 [Candidatus Falkowbacteria bacterium CG_4_9_14_3_um_filter_36_9]|uniref:Uncharacterized protein n=2 Tax=Candidatus Falkowiibacteriota TaxID=1752728 RepID=A0A1J4T6L5_9BACT|nr:MAG: hypothetical protein AUJ27_04050 [Candidatus Falkowbacteria bacterium CG1_02_37_44]PIV50784.1 MAG: hypothetical protein COS18_04085 [Candidatus Falkowbacteria bacterium CG02_land_8_20_14_3_00_36_14]PJA10976.1 MAG: hypothetical protein COX67_02140 [Candidatus Falkowbacteria bacterium CG_4_10_14_0_2_um_filter_36_22]PJB20167.1 MAG: hypothetical protein CO115_01725 [Candidatus Falkowbacteria bacterium CG_4_9_14_3_um_filter_36_9]